LFLFRLSPPPHSTLFPYTTLFRSPQRGLLHELLRVIAELESAYLAPPDVAAVAAALPAGASAARLAELGRVYAAYESELFRIDADRKSTRLNSSHVSISYAVFCLK